MELTFQGAVGTVTGSRTRVDVAGSSFLVDCGMYQGFKQLRLRNWEHDPDTARRVWDLSLRLVGL